MTLVVAITATAILWAWAGAASIGVRDAPLLWLAQGLIISSVPLISIFLVTRRRLVRAQLSGILDQLPFPPSIEGVQWALREAVADPTAAVLYRLPGMDFYIGADGLRTDVPTAPERLVLPALVESAHETGMALIHFHASLATEVAKVEVAVTTCEPALANARHQIISRLRVRELRESRTRIVTAGIEERRRLERNLHDGAQQVLLAVSARLGAARTRVTDQRSIDVLDAARGELRGALTDLRALTRDLFPAILATEGLAGALEAAADDQSMELSLDVTSERFSAEVESIAYLTVADLLAGLQRHTAANSASVRLARKGELLTIVVHYEALVEEKELPWLTGIGDRLRAVDGDVVFSTGKPGGHNLIEARIPCE